MADDLVGTLERPSRAREWRRWWLDLDAVALRAYIAGRIDYNRVARAPDELGANRRATEGENG